MGFYECGDCKLNFQHGGQCRGKNTTMVPCLLYEKDPRGKLMHTYCKELFIPFHLAIPKLKEECDYFEINGISKTLTITKINNVSWCKDKGLHGINMDVEYNYWSEENGELPPNKPKLTLIKGGKTCQE